ncbi:MAG: HTTM domain-containing protein [Alphaproteobacteria bacterium]
MNCTRITQKWNDLTQRPFETHDGASLAVFRIMLGILLLSDALNKFPKKFIIKDFRPTYHGFDWIQANPDLVNLCINILPYTIICVIFGFLYRITMPVTTLMVAYLFFAFPEHYLNHYYLLLLYLILMSVIPAHKTWSIDAIIQNKKEENTTPSWCYLILKLQTEIMLIFAGLVKINNDWLHLLPLSGWIRIGFQDIPIINHLVLYDTTIAIGAYGIILLHILGAPLLFHRKTRPWIFGLYVCFHLINSQIFHIGIFPFMAIAATLLFFAPNWPKTFWSKISIYILPPLTHIKNATSKSKLPRKIIIALISIWLLVQIVLPIPALLSTNLQVEWTGHRDMFSWRMMLNERSIKSAVFAVHIPERRRIEFVSLKSHLTPMQCFRITWSDTTVQFANYLEKLYQEKYDTNDVRVHAYIIIRVNLREEELWANPTIDISKYETKYGTYEWLEPANNKLRTWKEYVQSSNYEPPTYGEILDAMQLPNEEIIVFADVNDNLNSHPSKPRCE